MRDNPVHRAYRQGTKTTPVERKPRTSSAHGKTLLDPDEVARAVGIARQERIDRDIREYADKRRVEMWDDGTSAVRNVIGGGR